MKRILPFLLVLGGISCAGNVKKEIQAEKAQISDESVHQEMALKTRAMLDQAKNLTEEQKDQFIQVHGKVWAQSQEIGIEIKKIKIVLFKALLAKDYDKKKITVAKNQIRKLYNEKLDIMINAFDDVRSILGKDMELPYNSMWFERVHLY